MNIEEAMGRINDGEDPRKIVMGLLKEDEILDRRIREHGEKLNKIFNTGLDPDSLCRKLFRLERTMRQAALQYSNAQIDSKSLDTAYENTSRELDRLLRFKEKGIPVLINTDPRGYALKIDDAYVVKNNLDIPRDMGGYGLIAPDLREMGESRVIEAGKKEFTVFGVRWFDRGPGNTYHSVRVMRHSDGEQIAHEMTYGYGDSYRHTALMLMVDNKWLPPKYTHDNAYMYERENNYPIIWHVKEGTKRECIDNGKLDEVAIATRKIVGEAASEQQLKMALDAAKGGNWDKANEILHGFGIEYVSVEDRELKYINLGDTYDTTICQEPSEGKGVEEGEPFIGSWGDWVEKAEGEHQEETDTIKCGWCGHFTPMAGAKDWHMVKCQNCGHLVGESKTEDKTDTIKCAWCGKLTPRGKEEDWHNVICQFCGNFVSRSEEEER